jgi:5-methylcytosine-specific restriction endonuclease McrA
VALTVTLDRSTQNLLEYAQALLGHTVPSGDVGVVLDRALSALIEKLERRKFASTSKSRSSRRKPKAGSRHIPAAVKHTVWLRDGGRCTFVADNGHRCGSRNRLEFDHIDPVAKGGTAIDANLRLRCRTHNQFEAERVFGAEFMKAKREERQDETKEQDVQLRGCPDVR